LPEARHHQHKASLPYQQTDNRLIEGQVLLHTQTLLHIQEEAAAQAARAEALLTTARAYREALRPTTEVLLTTAITAVHHPQQHARQDIAEAVAVATAEAVPAEADIAAEAVAAHPEEEDRNNH
jgi:hypothetical protein